MKLFLFALLLLSACSEMTLHPRHVLNIEAACKDHGGWVEIYKSFAAFNARCHDGTMIDSGTVIK